MKRKKYFTKRFVLRAYTLRDYKIWFHAFTNLLPKQSPFDIGPYSARKCSYKIFEKMVFRHRVHESKGRTFIWGIFDKKTNTLVGSLDIHILCKGSIHKANLGYEVFNNYWRQGIAYEALSELIPKALIDLKINRLEATIDLDNKASIGLAKSLKFRSEGIRENYYFQNNQWCDQRIFVADRKLFKLPPLKIKD